MEKGGSRSPRNLSDGNKIEIEKSSLCSEYTSLRDTIVEHSSNTSNNTGNPLLRRAAMLYARPGAPPPLPPRPTTLLTLIKVCFGFN